MFSTAAQLIDAKGGNAAVARDTGISEGAIGLWKHRGRIPRAAWPDLMLAYSDVNLTGLLAIERGDHGEASGVDDAAVVAPASALGAGAEPEKVQ